MTFEQAYSRLQEIKELLESDQDLTLDQIKKLQSEAKECFELCEGLLKDK